MFGNKGYMLKYVKVQSCGHTADEFFCVYRYKDEYEPEVNKVKYPDKKDRWYEDYMFLSTVTEARKNGANVDISTYKNDWLEWNKEKEKYILQKHVFDDESDYFKQLN